MTRNEFENLYERTKYHLECKVQSRPNDAIPPKLQLAAVLEYEQKEFLNEFLLKHL